MSNRYCKIENRIKDFIRKIFDAAVTHKDKYKSTNTNSYKDEIRTDFPR